MNYAKMHSTFSVETQDRLPDSPFLPGMMDEIEPLSKTPISKIQKEDLLEANNEIHRERQKIEKKLKEQIASMMKAKK